MRNRVLILMIAAVLLGATANAQSWTESWLDMVSQTQAEQPHWVTPVVTVTPRLEQEFRFDLSHQQLNDGLDLWNVGGGKGLELIPTKRVELIVGMPAYFVRDNPRSPDGFGDETFLLKYRLFAGNEEHGNYILTAFVGGSLNTGSHNNGAPGSSITPTIAGGKGFGRFAVQSTVGVNIPTENTFRTGHAVSFNTAFQYHVDRLFWPEMEVNSTFFRGGGNNGRSQTFITPGVVVGRLPIHHRIAFTFGAGMQIAASQFHTFNHNLVLTARLPF